MISCLGRVHRPARRACPQMDAMMARCRPRPTLEGAVDGHPREVHEGVAHRAGRHADQMVLRIGHPGEGHPLRLLQNGMTAEPVHDLAERRIGVQIGMVELAEDLLPRGVDGSRLSLFAQEEDGHRVDALAQVGARGLARRRAVGAYVDDVVGDLEGHAHAFAVSRQDVRQLLGTARVEHTVHGGGRYEGPRLVLEHPDVVALRALSLPDAYGLVELPLA